MVTFMKLNKIKKNRMIIIVGFKKKHPIFPMFLVGGRCQCVFMTLFMHDKMKLCGSTLNHKKLH